MTKLKIKYDEKDHTFHIKKGRKTIDRTNSYQEAEKAKSYYENKVSKM